MPVPLLPVLAGAAGVTALGAAVGGKAPGRAYVVWIDEPEGSVLGRAEPCAPPRGCDTSTVRDETRNVRSRR